MPAMFNQSYSYIGVFTLLAETGHPGMVSKFVRYFFCFFIFVLFRQPDDLGCTGFSPYGHPGQTQTPGRTAFALHGLDHGLANEVAMSGLDWKTALLLWSDVEPQLWLQEMPPIDEGRDEAGYL